jgi:hypothetical protein
MESRPTQSAAVNRASYVAAILRGPGGAGK